MRAGVGVSAIKHKRDGTPRIGESFSSKEVKIKFKKAFANIPEKIKNEDIILVIDKKPYTPNTAFFEIENNPPPLS